MGRTADTLARWSWELRDAEDTPDTPPIAEGMARHPDDAWRTLRHAAFQARMRVHEEASAAGVAPYVWPQSDRVQDVPDGHGGWDCTWSIPRADLELVGTVRDTCAP